MYYGQLYLWSLKNQVPKKREGPLPLLSLCNHCELQITDITFANRIVMWQKASSWKGQ